MKPKSVSGPGGSTVILKAKNLPPSDFQSEDMFPPLNVSKQGGGAVWNHLLPDFGEEGKKLTLHIFLGDK